MIHISKLYFNKTVNIFKKEQVVLKLGFLPHTLEYWDCSWFLDCISLSLNVFIIPSAVTFNFSLCPLFPLFICVSLLL